MRAESLREPVREVRSVCPYCGVGGQVNLGVRGCNIQRVDRPWIEETTQNVSTP